MSIFHKACDEVKAKIPLELLTEAFKDDVVNWRVAPVSLDTRMMNKVIKARVLVDADLVGGVQGIIWLDGLVPRYADQWSVVYEIPAERTSNREIMSILSISNLPTATQSGNMGIGVGVVNPNSMNDVMSAGQRVMDSHSNIPVVSNATCDLIGYNTVLIRDQVHMTAAYQLRCMLANDNKMSNINPRSYLNFAQLVVWAVKAYIYNKLVIRVDQAYLSGGQELGAFKTKMDEYADSENEYQTFLKEVWMPTAFMNDQPTHTRYLKAMLSPGI